MIEYDEEDSLANAINRVAMALNKLGLADASTPMGAIELLSLSIKESASEISGGLHDIADAIRDRG